MKNAPTADKRHFERNMSNTLLSFLFIPCALPTVYMYDGKHFSDMCKGVRWMMMTNVQGKARKPSDVRWMGQYKPVHCRQTGIHSGQTANIYSFLLLLE